MIRMLFLFILQWVLLTTISQKGSIDNLSRNQFYSLIFFRIRRRRSLL